MLYICKFLPIFLKNVSVFRVLGIVRNALVKGGQVKPCKCPDRPLLGAQMTRLVSCVSVCVCVCISISLGMSVANWPENFFFPRMPPVSWWRCWDLSVIGLGGQRFFKKEAASAINWVPLSPVSSAGLMPHGRYRPNSEYSVVGHRRLSRSRFTVYDEIWWQFRERESSH